MIDLIVASRWYGGQLSVHCYGESPKRDIGYIAAARGRPVTCNHSIEEEIDDALSHEEPPHLRISPMRIAE